MYLCIMYEMLKKLVQKEGVIMDNFKELPMGFGMALLQNPTAAMRFHALSETEKQQIINQTYSIKSKDEMKEFVSKLK